MSVSKVNYCPVVNCFSLSKLPCVSVCMCSPACSILLVTLVISAIHTPLRLYLAQASVGEVGNSAQQEVIALGFTTLGRQSPVWMSLVLSYMY